MLSSQPVRLGIRCASCQRHVLGSFIAAIGSTTTVPPHRQVTRRAVRHYHLPGLAHSKPRPYTTSTLQDLDNELAGDDGSHGKQVSPIQEEPGADNIKGDAAPWYLQEAQEFPKRDINPFDERQRLPDLPSYPPPILQPLLKQISLDLGLDYLSVLDLRKLDPPPALGANLLMVFGSARSERHLNVSADRLCRWLRTTYKLTPHADGLLGRNELKLKLRRKARRSKMLGAVGARDIGDMDDGVSTGWICVDIGTVENGKGPAEEDASSLEVETVGFGIVSGGARIVIQMMTETKREDVDLEGLWKGVLNRQLRREQAAKKSRDEEQPQSQTKPGIGDASTSSGNRITTPMMPPAHKSHLHQQARAFHASSRQLSAPVTQVTVEDVPPQPAWTPSSKHDETLDGKGEALPPNKETVVAIAGEQRRTAQTYVDELTQLAPKVASRMLGKDQTDRNSTPFLRSFYRSIDVFPMEDDWHAIIELQCYAMTIGHPGYTRKHLHQLICDMFASVINIQEKTFVLMLRGLLLTPHDVDTSKYWYNPGHDSHNALRRSLLFAFDVLQKMEAYGYNTIRDDVLLMLNEATQHAVFKDMSIAEAPEELQLRYEKELSEQVDGAIIGSRSNIDASQASEMSEAGVTSAQNGGLRVPLQLHDGVRRKYGYLLRTAFAHLPKYPPSDRVIMTMVESYASHKDWKAVNGVWRLMARMMRPRSPELYALFFRLYARDGNQTKCQQVIKDHVPEMDKEWPPVKLDGDVAVAFEECLVAAKVDRNAFPWNTYWRRLRESKERSTGDEGWSPDNTVL